MRSRGLDVTDLTGRSAVVTGGGSGIGRSLCRLLAARGARVHVVDRDLPRAQAVAGETGGVAHHVDVADAAAVHGLADLVLGEGDLDLLCNNAGVGHAGAVVDTPLEDWRALVEVNLMGVVHGVQAFLPRLVAQARPAAVVNTASMAGLLPSAGMVPYPTTKAAVIALSEALDRELTGSGVRVHALCPGIIATDIVRTATLRGSWIDRRATVSRRYAAHGTSPDVVALRTLDAVQAGRVLVPVPRRQVVPPWLVKRVWPAGGAALSSLLVQGASRRT